MVEESTHVTELRTAIAAVRTRNGPLNQIHQALGRTVPTCTDPTLVAGETVVKAAHIQELRTAVNALP
jgi:phosphopantetheine adenylyltransferase